MNSRSAVLAICLSSAVFRGVASPEAELAAKLPETFAKAAAHYKALDAATTPLMKTANGEIRVPHGWNKWRTGKDEYDMRSIYWWTSGHYPGSLWHLYEATGDAFFRDRAVVWTEALAPVSKYAENHDVGFMAYCSFGHPVPVVGGKLQSLGRAAAAESGGTCGRKSP